MKTLRISDEVLEKYDSWLKKKKDTRKDGQKEVRKSEE